jgi:hypothetical protein
VTCVVVDLDTRRAADAGLMGEDVLCDWLRALDLDPGLVKRVQVWADGDGTVVADCMIRAAAGVKWTRIVDGEAEAMTEVVVRALTAPIPAAVLAAGRP